MTCIHGLMRSTCSVCLGIKELRGVEVFARNRSSASRAPGRRYTCPDCPHGRLIHGACGCWKCGCIVTWTEKSDELQA